MKRHPKHPSTDLLEADDEIRNEQPPLVLYLDWVPVRPNSVKIRAASGIILRDASHPSNFDAPCHPIQQGDIVLRKRVVGHINYTLGTIWITDRRLEVACPEVSYRFNPDSTVPADVQFKVSRSAVRSRKRKLRTKWTVEANQKLECWTGVTGGKKPKRRPR